MLDLMTEHSARPWAWRRGTRQTASSTSHARSARCRMRSFRGVARSADTQNSISDEHTVFDLHQMFFDDPATDVGLEQIQGRPFAKPSAGMSKPTQRPFP